MTHISRYSKKLLQTAAITAALVALGIICRRVSYATENVFVDKLANYVRIYIYIGLFAVWGVSVRRRVVQFQVRRYLVAISILMVLWLTLREFRWHLVLNIDALRLLWYAYYVFTLMIPLLALFVSLSLGQPETYRLPKQTFFLYIPTICLILLVLTNDLTQFVFRFQEGAVWTEENYQYMPGYYLVTAWGVLCAAAAFTVMLTKCKLPRPGKFLWLPLIPFGVAVLYIALYAIRVPFVRNILGDLTVTECLLFTSFFESCIQCGLIQSNTRYSDLFRASVNISAQITDNEYVVRYAASGAEAISKEDMLHAEADPVVLAEGKRLHNMPISGGHAIWTEDISELLELQETLADTREELKERNEFLHMEYEQEKEYRRVIEQNRLYDLLQTQTQNQLDEVSRLTADYEKAKDETEKRRILAKIAVLGSYIKRRKDFVLLMEGASAIPENRLISALAESFRSLALGGIRGTFLVDTGREILSGEIMTLAYDFFENVIETVLDQARYVTVNIGTVGGTLRCFISTDCVAGSEALLHIYPKMIAAPNEEGGTEYILPLMGGEGA